MFSSIILESVKEYIPNSYIENNEKYDFIVGSKVKKKLVFKIIHNYIFIFSRIKDNNFSLLIHEISEKIKNIKGKICIIYIYDFDLVEENNKFLFFIKKNNQHLKIKSIYNFYFLNIFLLREFCISYNSSVPLHFGMH